MSVVQLSNPMLPPGWQRTIYGHHLYGHDDCEMCMGTRGGVPGNENVLRDGRVICDYCHADEKVADAAEAVAKQLGRMRAALRPERT